MRKITLHKKVKFLVSTFFLLVIITACGFTPVHKMAVTEQGSSLQLEFNSIYIPFIKDKDGVDLRNSLMDTLYTADRSRDKYILDVTQKSVEKTSLALASDGSATRAQLKTTYNVVLKNTSDVVLLNQDVISSSTYNILGSQYSTLVASEEAVTRSIRKATDDIIFTLRDYFLVKDEQPEGVEG